MQIILNNLGRVQHFNSKNLKRLSMLLCFIFFNAPVNAQTKDQITISGTVLDASDGTSIPFASISVLPSKVIGTTDGKGGFSIKITKGTEVFFSYIGYEKLSQRFSTGQSNVSIKLKISNAQLNDVVVTALGIKREERALGYAITKLDSTQITNAPAGNWIDALSGKVAGLNMVRSNGGPAGSNKIILRGESNLTGGADNEALIVVDGVVINNGSGKRTSTGGSAASPSDGI